MLLSATLILITLSRLLSRIHLKYIEKFNQNFDMLEFQGFTTEAHYKRDQSKDETILGR